MSVTAAGADYNWPDTYAMNIFCTENSPFWETNNAAAQGQYLGTQMTSGKYNMYLVDDCAAAESTWNGDYAPIPGKTGMDVVDHVLNKKCKPFH